MKVGIIGSTGMLGHHTAIAVKNAGYALTVIHREGSDLSRISHLNYESRIGDLNKKDGLIKAFHGLDMVLNCGAYYPTAPLPLRQELETAKSQITNFIAAVEESKVPRALYLGGAIAIPLASSGLGNESGYYTESPTNKTPYVQVKWLMDDLVTKAGKNGIPITIGIPTMTFGEYDYGPTTGKLIVDIVNGDLPAYIRGNRNIVYAGDAGQGLLLACEKGKPGERYLITGQNTSMNELVKVIAKSGQVTPPTKVLPLGVAKIISFIQEFKYKLFKGKLPQLSATAIAVLSAGQHIDGTKAQNELGYSPQVNLEESVERSINWFKKNGYIR